ASTGSAPPTRAERRPTARRAGARSRRCENRARDSFYSCFCSLTTVQSGQGGQELLDVERGQGLDPGRAAGGERDRHLRDRGDVGRLDHVDEVELAEGRPLVEHAGAELLDVLFHLPQALRVRLERLD